ncbi:MAG: hypothetical protein BWY55_00191 [archaeon ADurb.Bin336]|nr:MAG: hypothetical protein BWY55_00191 [archaeon ADurb.Bin336]
MKLSDKVTSLLKEEDYSFEELKQKTKTDFFELKDTIKELLKEEKIFKQGFPTKYSLTKSSFKQNLEAFNNYKKTIYNFKEIFLIITTGLLLVLLYSVFLKNPFLYPGLEQRTFLLFLPLLLITLLLYVPWSKVINIIPKNIIPKETFLFLDKAKHLTSIKELKQYAKEFSDKILFPYYPHLLIILSVFSLFKIEFFSSFNTFFTPIALYLILISILLIILKQKKPSFFKEKEICKYSFLLLLILVTISSLNFEQITFITEPLKAMQFQLTLFTIILGAITFYQNKEIIEEIEEEQNAEEKEEEKRALEFEKKYSKLANIPLAKHIFKWMYKAGWIYSSLLISIIIIFLIIRIGMPVVYTGNYIDEYYHILNGVSLLENGEFTQFYSEGSMFEGYYLRGSYVSIFVAFSFFFFGQSLLAAKLVPLVISLIIFLFLYKILKNNVTSKFSIISGLLIYTLTYFTIFNHFYIRMYIFYELFIVLSIFLFFKTIYFVNINNIKGTSISLIGLFFIGIINTVYSNDYVSLMSSFVNTYLVIYLILFELKKIKITNKNIFSKLLVKKNEIFILKLLICLIYILFNFSIIVPVFFSFTISSKSSQINSITHLFEIFLLSLPFIVLIFVNFTSFFLNISKSKKSLLFMGLIIGITYSFASKKLQFIRIFMFTYPIFIILITLSLRNIINIYLKKRKIFILFSIILFATLINQYPLNFFDSPSLVDEINYSSYKETSDFLNNFCLDKQIIVSIHRPAILTFYGVRIDKTTYLSETLLKSDSRYFKDSNNNYFELLKKIPVYTNKDFFKKLDSNFCVVINDELKHSNRYLSSTDLELLKMKFDHNIFLGDYNLIVYYN